MTIDYKPIFVGTITKANLPPIGAAPAAGDLITFSGTTVMIPD